MKTRLTLITGLAASLVACSADKAPVDETITDSAELTSPIAVEAAGGNPAAELASQQIKGDYMRGIIVEISDDRYEGRGPGSAGDEMTRRYLAGVWKNWAWSQAPPTAAGSSRSISWASMRRSPIHGLSTVMANP